MSKRKAKTKEDVFIFEDEYGNHWEIPRGKMHIFVQKLEELNAQQRGENKLTEQDKALLAKMKTPEYWQKGEVEEV